MTTNTKEFDEKHGIIDSETPRNHLLCGRYRRSFAYHTFQHRIPNILNCLLESVERDLNANNHSQDDIKHILNSIGKLKCDIENDDHLEKFAPNELDKDIALWNEFIATLPDDASTFYKTCWLYAECYLYRRIYSFFRVSPNLKDYDYFTPQKQHALHISMTAMEELVRSAETMANNFNGLTHMIKVNLWGNKCDLSLSTGQEVKPLDSLNKHILDLNPNILVDDCEEIWNCLNEDKTQLPNKRYVDLICDNAGFELLTDLLLAKYLIENKLAGVIRFHVKAMPWFVSDTTPRDIQYTLKFMENNSSSHLKGFGKECLNYFNNGQFEIITNEDFWTTPYEFYRMCDINHSLYNMLSTSSLIIFKGDLNYRKLLGDYNWDPTEKFQTCLRGFNPSNLCTLRTIKADLICGLKPGQAEELTSKQIDWMLTGEYAVIQFAKGAK
ncbi:damage-control phosphatase ARMT1-like [Haematobia irritans]|uniref:damage-control phosphatase ARMT1-like n=1 Tax=Haematobia irritans TaxID=7368 RepID=UPI003F50CE3A